MLWMSSGHALRLLIRVKLMTLIVIETFALTIAMFALAVVYFHFLVSL